MSLKLKAEELREAFAKLRGCLIEGLDDNQIAERLKLSWAEVQELKHRFDDNEAEALRTRSTEHTYVRYVIEQRRCLADLDKVIADYQQQKNVAAYVGAIRAKSDILERVLKTGQDLGLIERFTKGEGYVAGEAIKNMNNIQFQQFILNVIGDLDQLRLRYGDQPLGALEPGPLHRPLVARTPVKGHSRSAVYGGRRVVKES